MLAQRFSDVTLERDHRQLGGAGAVPAELEAGDHAAAQPGETIRKLDAHGDRVGQLLGSLEHIGGAGRRDETGRARRRRLQGDLGERGADRWWPDRPPDLHLQWQAGLVVHPDVDVVDARLRCRGGEPQPRRDPTGDPLGREPAELVAGRAGQQPLREQRGKQVDRPGQKRPLFGGTGGAQRLVVPGRGERAVGEKVDLAGWLQAVHAPVAVAAPPHPQPVRAAEQVGDVGEVVGDG